MEPFASPASTWWTVNPGQPTRPSNPPVSATRCASRRRAMRGCQWSVTGPGCAIPSRTTEWLPKALGMAFAQFRQRQLEGFTEQVVELGIQHHAVDRIQSRAEPATTAL